MAADLQTAPAGARRMRAGPLCAALCVGASVVAALPALAQPGTALFAQNCSACHQASGKGAPGAFPALAGDPFVEGAKAPLISTVLKGRGGMPRFADQLDNAQIAGVLSYVRSAWGNGAGPVTPAEVAKLRAGPQPPKSTGGMQAR